MLNSTNPPPCAAQSSQSGNGKKVITCEWCGNTMHMIANHGSGFLRDCADTWLCDNTKCGHEREVIRGWDAAYLF